MPDRLAIANKLLDDAGLPRKDGGMRFGLHLEVNSFGEQWLRQAEYLKQALAQVGIDVTLRSEDTATWLRRVYTDYDFDINEPFLSQGVDPVIGLNKQYLTSQIRKGVTFVNEQLQYSNPEVDQPAAGGHAGAGPRPGAGRSTPDGAADPGQRTVPLIPLIDVQYVSRSSTGKLHDHTTGPLGHVARRSSGPGWRSSIVFAWGSGAVECGPRTSPYGGGLMRLVPVPGISRVLLAVPVILGIVVLNFFLIHLAPGDAASVLAGESGAATPEYMATLRHKFGLDQPLEHSVLSCTWSHMAHFDLGYSFRNDSDVLGELIVERLGPTRAADGDRVRDRAAGARHPASGCSRPPGATGWRDGVDQSVLSLVAYATPGFWLGLMMIVVFAIRLAWLPTSGFDTVGADNEGWDEVGRRGAALGDAGDRRSRCSTWRCTRG